MSHVRCVIFLVNDLHNHFSMHGNITMITYESKIKWHCFPAIIKLILTAEIANAKNRLIVTINYDNVVDMLQ